MSLFYKFFWTVNLIVFLLILVRMICEWMDGNESFLDAMRIAVIGLLVWNVFFAPLAFGLKFIWSL